MNKLTVSAGPHILSTRTTQKVMGDVLIALLPAVLAGVVLFGWRSLAVIATCIGAAVLSEYLFTLACHKETTVGDLSAMVTGLILALNLPSTMPLWEAALGSVVAIVVVKCLFGGLGANFANPAVVGRIVLFVAFASDLIAPVSNFSSLFGVDMVTGATPLTQLDEGLDAAVSPLQMLLGTYGGMIGETCAVALLLGFAYLLARRVITWHIPVSLMGTVALVSLCCGRDVLTDLFTG
ncbi:MAG: RnfABCDGE type electron transport complex subunit D, partial [Clostridia bacterium]|nr:RnfABCDGE type electron transport complex subunit D [Clostridia bacterium]